MARAAAFGAAANEHERLRRADRGRLGPVGPARLRRRAGDAARARAPARDLLATACVAAWVGLAGFLALSEPAAFDLSRYGRMSGPEQRQVKGGAYFAVMGLAQLAWYALARREARRRRRSDEAVARAIRDWKAEQGQD